MFQRGARPYIRSRPDSGPSSNRHIRSAYCDAGSNTRADRHIRSDPHCDAGAHGHTCPNCRSSADTGTLHAGFRVRSHWSYKHAGPAGAHVRAVAG